MVQFCNCIYVTPCIIHRPRLKMYRALNRPKLTRFKSLLLPVRLMRVLIIARIIHIYIYIYIYISLSPLAGLDSNYMRALLLGIEMSHQDKCWNKSWISGIYYIRCFLILYAVKFKIENIYIYKETHLAETIDQNFT